MPFWQHQFNLRHCGIGHEVVEGWAMILRLLLVPLGIWACASTHAKQRVDGSYSIDCNSQKACLERANKLCGETGYSIVGGRHDQKIYGTPGNQKVVGRDELYVRCTKDAPVDAPDPAAGSWKLERPDSGAQQVQPRKHKNSICRAGETQRCVGPGACSGGQACEADGTRFGPCDCGEPATGHAASTVNSRDAGNQ